VYLIFKNYLNKVRLPGLEGPELIVVTVQWQKPNRAYLRVTVHRAVIQR